MPPKKKQRFLSLQQQEQAIQDFLDNISDEEETPFKKSPMMKRRSQPFRRVNRKVKKVMKNTSNFQESNCLKLLMNVVMKQTTSTWKFRTRKINRIPIPVQTRNLPGSGIQRKKEKLVAELQTKTY